MIMWLSHYYNTNKQLQHYNICININIFNIYHRINITNCMLHIVPLMESKVKLLACQNMEIQPHFYVKTWQPIQLACRNVANRFKMWQPIPITNQNNTSSTQSSHDFMVSKFIYIFQHLCLILQYAYIYKYHNEAKQVYITQSSTTSKKP